MLDSKDLDYFKQLEVSQKDQKVSVKSKNVIQVAVKEMQPKLYFRRILTYLMQLKGIKYSYMTYKPISLVVMVWNRTSMVIKTEKLSLILDENSKIDI